MAIPAHKIRNGVLQVTIWRNTTDNGKVWYSVNTSRSYKAGDDGWRQSDSLNTDDLLPMAKLLDQAHTWITRQAKPRKGEEVVADDTAA